MSIKVAPQVITPVLEIFKDRCFSFSGERKQPRPFTQNNNQQNHNRILKELLIMKKTMKTLLSAILASTLIFSGSKIRPGTNQNGSPK